MYLLAVYHIGDGVGVHRRVRRNGQIARRHRRGNVLVPRADRIAGQRVGIRLNFRAVCILHRVHRLAVDLIGHGIGVHRRGRGYGQILCGHRCRNRRAPCTDRIALLGIGVRRDRCPEVIRCRLHSYAVHHIGDRVGADRPARCERGVARRRIYRGRVHAAACGIVPSGELVTRFHRFGQCSIGFTVPHGQRFLTIKRSAVRVKRDGIRIRHISHRHDRVGDAHRAGRGFRCVTGHLGAFHLVPVPIAQRQRFAIGGLRAVRQLVVNAQLMLVVEEMDLIGCLICHVAERRAGHSRRHLLAVEHTDGQRVYVRSQIRFQRFVALRHFDGRLSHSVHQIELILIVDYRLAIDRNARNFFVAEQRRQKRNTQHVIGEEVRSEHIDVNDICLRLGELGDRAAVTHIHRVGQQRVRRQNLSRDVRFQIGLGKHLHCREEYLVASHLTVLFALHRGQVLIIALRRFHMRAAGCVEVRGRDVVLQQREVRHIVQGHGRVLRDILRRALGVGEAVASDGGAGQIRRSLVLDASRGIRLNLISVLIHILERHGVSVDLPLGIEREVFRRHRRGCICRRQFRIRIPPRKGIAGLGRRLEFKRIAAVHGLFSKLGLAVHVRHRIRQRLQLRIERQILCGHGAKHIASSQRHVGIPTIEPVAVLAVFQSRQRLAIPVRF